MGATDSLRARFKGIFGKFRRLTDDVPTLLRAFSTAFALYEISLHPFCTQIMASIRKQRSGR